MQPDYADALDDLMKTPSWRIPLSTVNGESSLDCRRVLNKRLTSTNLDSNFESNFESGFKSLSLPLSLPLTSYIVRQRSSFRQLTAAGSWTAAGN